MRIKKYLHSSINRNSLIAVSVVSLSVLCILFVNLFILGNNTADATPSSSELQRRIDELQPTIDQTSAEYNAAQIRADESAAAINEAQSRIDYCNEKIPKLQKNIAANMKKEYMEGSDQLKLFNQFFGIDSLGKLIKVFEALDEINQKNTSDISECKNLRQEVQTQMTALHENHKINTEALESAAAARSQAESAMAELRTAYDNATEEEREATRRQSQGGGSHGGGGYNPGPNVPMTGNEIADRALGELGKPYVFGATGPNAYDCSGLVGYAITGAYGRHWSTFDYITWPQCPPTVGCVVTTMSHCGVYIGDGMMVHAPHPEACVCIAPVQAGMIYVSPWG